MKSMHVKIESNDLTTAYNIAVQILEFENLYSIEEFEKRLNGTIHLILIAYYKNKPIGFKIGYETLADQHFYSWMGGILKKYRKSGVAQLLLDQQEEWVKNNGYKRILVKTRKKHVAMINFLKKNSYREMGYLPHNPDEETRYLFEKEL